MSKSIMNMCALRSFLKPPIVRHFHPTALHRKSKKLLVYVVHRYMEHLKRFEKVLERSLPKTMGIYRLFTGGMKTFTFDLKNYLKILRMLSSLEKDVFSKLTRREIELYHQMPKDLRKVTPILLFSTLPFSYFFIFPMMFLIPRLVLSKHFWTSQQISENNVICLRRRLLHNRLLFQCVQEELEGLKTLRLYDKWALILEMIGNGGQPSVEQILHCKDLFMCKPYHLFYLKRRHVRYLLKIHGLHIAWFRLARLSERAVILQEMDKAILREGGADNMPVEALKNALFIRGLNPSHMSEEDMINWLHNWIKISFAVDRDSLSLLLHGPILLAYNEPSNWALINKKKRSRSNCDT